MATIAQGQDITERKRAEEALRETNEYLENLFNYANAPIIVWDPQFRITRFNRAFEKLTGRRAGDVIGKSLEILFPPALVESSMDLIRKTLSGARWETVEIAILHLDGSVRTVLWNSANVIATDGKTPVATIAQGQDITERKRTEERLLHLTEVLRAVRNVNQLITHEKNRDTLLRRACEILTETRGYRSAWIGTLDAAGAIHAAAQSGIGTGFASVSTQLERGEWPECCREALGRPGIVIMHDTAVNCVKCPLAHTYRDTAALAQRLQYAGHNYGVLVVALPAAEADDDEEQSLFRELCGDVSFALHAIEVEQERQRAEDGLRESQASLVAAQAVAHLGNWAWDSVRDEITGSDEFYRLFGVKPEQLARYRQFINLLHPDDCARVEQDVADAMKQSRPYDTDYRVLLPNGEYRHINARGQVFVDDTGKPIRMVGTCLDITERKRTEEERRRLDMAVNQAAESVIITDGQGVIQYVNPAFERMTGYSRDELMGRNAATLPSAEHHDTTLDREVAETLGRGEVWRGRIVTRRKDGSEFTAETSISPVRDSAGNIVSRVAISRDITNEILMEARVRQAQKMEAIGTLAGGIAHDFNNVLAAIIGYGQIAASELAPDSPLQKDLTQVLCAADRAKNLVRQILTFSRQVEEERKPIELGIIVNEALQFLRPSLPTTIEIHTHIDTDSGPVLADPTQAHQVVMNLCTNAYHAMRDAGGVLTLSVEPFQVDSHLIQSHPGLHEGPYVRLSVSDTGCGMDKDVQERIFEPFFTTKAKGEGTGLGLATVHGIVSAHGGVITVYTEVGKGSTFRVYLPRAEPGLSEPSLLERPVQGGHEHILVLDDEEVLANLMERTLAPLGYDVVAMTNSADAFAAFKAHPNLFDLIVTDQTMPNMTGEQLAVEVRRIRPDMPVILITGFTGGELRERLTGIGVSAVLVKPVRPLEMARVVRQVLDEHSFKGKTIQDPASV